MGRAFDLSGSYSGFLTGLSGLMLVAAALTLILPAYDQGAGKSRVQVEANTVAD
jgi:hypothetical protein